MFVLRVLLFPFSVIYDVIMRIRNRMYDTGRKPSVAFDLPVICVGNLAVGGAGKTPMVEYLVRLLIQTHKVALLSRGYGRRTKGFRVAVANDTAQTIGDEPLQLFAKFGDRVPVAVGEERALAIPCILDQYPETQVIVLDDAFQHRRIRPGLSILLTEYSNPFYNDYVLPGGRLRECRAGANRADIIVVTKCPVNLEQDEISSITHRIHQVAVKPVFFSAIQYGEPVPMQSHTTVFSNRVVLISAIANHRPLEDYVRSKFELIHHFTFRDHHHYTLKDLDSISKYVSEQGPVSILTTEKDRVKLEHGELKQRNSGLPLFYLPIEMRFIINGKDFDRRVHDFVARG